MKREISLNIIKASVRGEIIDWKIFSAKDHSRQEGHSEKLARCFVPPKMQTFWHERERRYVQMASKEVNEGHANSRLRSRIKTLKASGGKPTKLGVYLFEHCN